MKRRAKSFLVTTAGVALGVFIGTGATVLIIAFVFCRSSNDAINAMRTSEASRIPYVTPPPTSTLLPTPSKYLVPEELMRSLEKLQRLQLEGNYEAACEQSAVTRDLFMNWCESIGVSDCTGITDLVDEIADDVCSR
jgi:hypothetical protein